MHLTLRASPASILPSLSTFTATHPALCRSSHAALHAWRKGRPLFRRSVPADIREGELPTTRLPHDFASFPAHSEWRVCTVCRFYYEGNSPNMRTEFRQAYLSS